MTGLIGGLEDIAARYDGLLCDVWGVVHNGVSAFQPAVEALRRFRATRGPILLVTNAPRPAPLIRRQLAQLGVADDAYDDVLTSGDVTRDVIAARPGVKVFHLGPERDLPFYRGLDIALVPEEEAELVSCTGLFDDTSETPDDYDAMLRRLAGRGLAMACANPDLVVERGDTLVYCAGALAQRYQALGGKTIIVGKPHPPIYAAAQERLARLGVSRVLAVGDGLPTDIKGAHDAGIDVLFITGGIHEADFGPAGTPDPARVSSRLAAEGLGAVAFLPTLRWARASSS
jgi:HAD superfamily hydrolase (TIGR01459 family)